MHRRFFTGAMAAACLAGAGSRNFAQAAGTWPDRPVRLIVNFAPGGSTDNAIRPFADRLSRLLGEQFVIENRGGASGALGLEAGVRSPPDGYTFIVTPALTVTILPHMRKLPVDVFRDLVPVSLFADGTLLVAVSPSLPVRSIQDLTEYARANPGKLGWGTAGYGSQGHMILEAFKQQAGVDILHVPYRGGGESLADFLAGVVQVHADPNTLPHVATGKARLLSVLDRQRHPDHPQVPVLREVYPKIDFFGWFGLYAPAGTPDAIVRKLNAALNQVAGDAEMTAQFRRLALRPHAGTPEDLARTMAQDHATYGRMVKELNLRME